VPYVITSGTTITTDPSITTNGVTNEGKIYQGAAIDGPASAWGFGSTSAFDTASGFDSQVIGSGAAFKFTALELTGNPTISTANGEVNLGLIAVNGITSGSPGGPLTFSGIRGLLLATQNGPIALGPEISFSGLHDITLYARGATSVLTLASDISTTNDIRLYGENAVLATGNLSTQRLTAAAGTTISIGGGGPTTINASEASLLIPNSGSGNIPSAAISLLSVGNLALNGSDGLSLTIDNTNGGHIGQDANIFLTAANLDAGSLNVIINNRDGGSIGLSAQVLCSTAGTLNVQGDAAIGISNRNDGGGGGTTGTDAIVTVQANSISVGGELDAFASANGGHIGNIGAVVFNVTGDLHSGGDMFFETQATAFNSSGGPLTPGFIGSDALVGVSAGGNITSDGFIDGDILTTDGGHIVGNASILLNATGDINGAQGIGGVISLFGGGKIDASALVVLNAQNIVTASKATGTPGVDPMALEASIYSNAAGTVGGDALVSVQAVQDISAAGETLFGLMKCRII